MTLLYESATCRLYLGDCLEILPKVSFSCDLLVTDPPYGIAYDSYQSRHHAKLSGDSAGATDLVADALKLVDVRKKRHAYVFWSPKVPHPPSVELGFQKWTPLVWDKGSLGMGGQVWSLSHESVLFSVRVKSKSEIAENRGLGAARMRRQSVLRFPRMQGAGTRRHPTEKPVPLLKEMIESSSRMGDTVVDPFAGVGSTLVAAILSGRKTIGIEIDPRYAALAAERVAEADRLASEAQRV